jgi:hypothetical protein
LANQPTHRVTHKDGWEAHIYIALSLQQKLASSNPAVRKGARDSVCIAFREACKSIYGGSWKRGYDRIEWHEIRLCPNTEQLAQQHSERDEDDDAECDDCTSCEIGYHERCRQPGGCPNAALR